jgi:hypothetical protein
MHNAAAPQAPDLVETIFVLGMLVLMLGAGVAVIVRRWQGSGEPDSSLWSPRQITSRRHWLLGLGVLIIVGWACAAIALIDAALRPGVAASLSKAIGPVPLPQWFALVMHPQLDYHGTWYLLWASATCFLALIEDRKDGPPRPFKPIYGFVCFLALASIAANMVSIWA